MPDYLDFVPDLSLQVHRNASAAGAMLARLEDAERAHILLDEIGIPRVLEPGACELSLASRVACLHGHLVSAARVLAHAQVVEERKVRYTRGR